MKSNITSKLALACCLLFATNCLSAQSLTTDLVFYLPINGNANDVSGNGLNATTNGNFVPDRNGVPSSAIYVNGNAQTITLANNPLLHPQLPMSVSMYINFDAFGNAFFANDFTPSIYTGMWMGTVVDGTIHLNFGDGGPTGPPHRRAKTSNGMLTLHNWHHVVGVIRAWDDMDIYIDCVNAGGWYDGDGGAMVYAGNSAKVGVGAATNQPGGAIYMQARVDEIAFWSRALSPGDVEKLCSGELNNLVTSAVETITVDDLQFSPNPVQDRIIVRLGHALQTAQQLAIIDLTGKVVSTLNMTGLAEYTIDVADLASGMYFVRATTPDGKSVTKKLIKQ